MLTQQVEEILANRGHYLTMRELAVSHPKEVEKSAMLIAQFEPEIPAGQKEYAAFLLELHASQVTPMV